MISSTVAQSHRHDGKIMPRAHRSLPVTSIVRATIQPDAQSVSGMIEISLRNDFESDIEQAYLYLPRGGYGSNDSMICRIDSLLYNGVPVVDSSSQVEGPVILVNLPNPLPKGRSGLFLMSFTTVLPSLSQASNRTVIIHDVFPRLCLFDNGEWFISPVAPYGHPPGSFAQVNLELSIDPSFMLAFGGEVINELEHLGTIPNYEDGEVYVDIGGSDSEDKATSVGAGVEEADKAVYYVRLRKATSATIVIGKQLLHDRVKRDSVLIDVFYSKGIRDRWQETAIQYASDLTHDMKPWLGDYPNDRLTIIATEDSDGWAWPDHVIAISADGRNSVELETEIAIRLGQTWVPQYLIGVDRSLVWSGRGVGLFASIKARQLLFAENRQKAMKIIRAELKRSGSSSMTLLWDYVVTPSWLNVITQQLSKLTVQKKLQQYNQQFAFRYPSSLSLETLMFEGDISSESEGFPMLSRNDLLTGIDFHIDEVEVINGDESLVTLSIKSSCTCSFPLEIGYVSSSDTAFQQMEISANQTVVTMRLSSGIQAIVLDPHHYLPDMNRANNYWFSLPIRYRYHPPKNMFPAYHYLNMIGSQ